MKPNTLKIFIIILLCNIPSFSCADRGDTLSVAFYNLENLFDTLDDSLKLDEEWNIGGEKEWTEERLGKKFLNLTKVISEMNDGEGVDILGFCESENEAVAQRWNDEYFGKDRRRIAYLESPDGRGIDVGVMYKPEKLVLLSVSGDTVHPIGDSYPTRLVLNVNFLKYATSETLHVFVNHWPSRRGNGGLTEQYRIKAAGVLRNRVNELFRNNKFANIIIMGDFNDEPTDISIIDTLGAFPFYGEEEEIDIYDDPQLFNLAYEKKINGDGSYKYRDSWNMLDQIIVSSNLINGNLRYLPESFEVFKPDWLKTYSGKYKGTPFPTYGGSNYLGGYSDHFPVRARFYYKK